jgi:zinc transporter
MPSPAPSSSPASTDGLLHAFELDGAGGGQRLDWSGVLEAAAAEATEVPCWVHLDRKHPQAQQWLREKSGLDPLICDALLTEETRPRVQFHETGALIILRGVNLNPGAAPDDMISVRMWVDKGRLITLRSPKLHAIHDVREALEGGSGPKTPGAVVLAIAQGLSQRVQPVLANLGELLDGFEEQVLAEQGGDLRRSLVALRRQAITLRRFLGPQREAIAALASTPAEWLSDRQRSRFRELGDRVMRDLEELEALRDRSAVVQEELSNRLAERMNRIMYVLSVITGVFLPLGLLTGLLGINVGGMPGVESDHAFWIVCVILVAFGGGSFWLFRRWRLL